MTFPRGILDTDRVVPTGAFTSPAAGNVSGVVTLTVNAADNDKVASVQFRVDGTNIGAPDTVAPFTMNYDTGALSNGSHTFSAIITDRVGNTSTPSVSVTVVNVPTVVMTGPGNGSSISGSINISANVTSSDPSVSVQFQVDGLNVGSPQTGTGAHSVSYDTHLKTNGAHTFACVVTDTHSNSASASVSATVANVTPAAGTALLGDLMTWYGGDDEGSPPGYYNQRSGPEPYDGNSNTLGDWYWRNTGDRFTPIHVPNNPDPTHYQMRAWFTGSRLEPGSAGNVVYIDVSIGGAGRISAWINGDYAVTTFLQNINGGESFMAWRWCTIVGQNNCFTWGVGVYYDFVPKSGYNS